MPSVSNLARDEEYDSVGEIMAYEDGTIDEDRFIKLFQYLVNPDTYTDEERKFMED